MGRVRWLRLLFGMKFMSRSYQNSAVDYQGVQLNRNLNQPSQSYVSRDLNVQSNLSNQPSQSYVSRDLNVQSNLSNQPSQSYVSRDLNVQSNLSNQPSQSYGSRDLNVQSNLSNQPSHIYSNQSPLSQPSQRNQSRIINEDAPVRSNDVKVDPATRITQEGINQSMIYSDVAELLTTYPIPSEVIWNYTWALIGDDLVLRANNITNYSGLSELLSANFNSIGVLEVIRDMISVVVESNYPELIDVAFGQENLLSGASSPLVRTTHSFNSTPMNQPMSTLNRSPQVRSSGQTLKTFSAGIFRGCVVMKYDKSEDAMCRAAIIGLRYGNLYRSVCPNYCYTFYPVINSEVADDIDTRCIRRYTPVSMNLLTEYISNMTLESAINSNQVSDGDLISIAEQLTQALKLAYEDTGFQHNHLRLSNIMLRHNPSEYVYYNRVGSIRAKYIAVIINYSHATVGSKCDNRYVNINYNLHPLSDIYGVIIDIAKRIPNNSTAMAMARYFDPNIGANNINTLSSTLPNDTIVNRNFDDLFNHITNIIYNGEPTIITNYGNEYHSNSYLTYGELMSAFSNISNSMPSTILELEMRYSPIGIDDVTIEKIYNNAIISAIEVGAKIKKLVITRNDVDNSGEIIHLWNQLQSQQPRGIHRNKSYHYDRIVDHYRYVVDPILTHIESLIGDLICNRIVSRDANLVTVVNNERSICRITANSYV